MQDPVRRLLVVFSAGVVLAAACGGNDPARPEESVSGLQRIAASRGEAEVGARGMNDFALELLRLNTGLDEGNVALSPWSIAIALAMTRVGARSETASEMDRVLNVGDEATYDQTMNALDQQLRGRNRSTPMGDGDPLVVELSAANRLFVQRGLTLLPGFLDTLAARYGAGVGEVDYRTETEAARRAINRWVADETRRRVPELLAKGLLEPRTRLVLANAVFLRADWAVPFEKSATADGTFHTPSRDVAVPFMRASERWGWSEGDGWKAVELPYTGGELSMTFVVPDAGEFDRVVSGMDRPVLDQVVTTQPTEVRLRLPKFSIDRPVLLGQQLRAVGMPRAFTDQADFSGITTDEQLQIAEVAHQANITVDERGTVAAAATAAIARAVSGTTAEPKTLVIDRPFLFFLRDRPTGALLFAGQITDPA